MGERQPAVPALMLSINNVQSSFETKSMLDGSLRRRIHNLSLRGEMATSRSDKGPDSLSGLKEFRLTVGHLRRQARVDAEQRTQSKIRSVQPKAYRNRQDRF